MHPACLVVAVFFVTTSADGSGFFWAASSPSTGSLPTLSCSLRAFRTSSLAQTWDTESTGAGPSPCLLHTVGRSSTQPARPGPARLPLSQLRVMPRSESGDVDPRLSAYLFLPSLSPCSWEEPVVACLVLLNQCRPNQSFSGAFI